MYINIKGCSIWLLFGLLYAIPSPLEAAKNLDFTKGTHTTRYGEWPLHWERWGWRPIDYEIGLSRKVYRKGGVSAYIKLKQGRAVQGFAQLLQNRQIKEPYMSSSGLVKTPNPPYYAVIFTSRRTDGDNGDAAMADRMVELASQQPGFLGIESARDADGVSITVSYWENEEAIRRWKQDVEHKVAQKYGKQTWYQEYMVRVSKVERAYGN